MKTDHKSDVHDAVRRRYAALATAKATSCCGDPGETVAENASDCAPGGECCTPSAVDTKARRIGYSDGELGAVPEGANLGLGCGNPQAIASLSPGEVVLDLGSGAGFDCFLAARAVGPTGRVIGVDMTPEMLDKAKANADAGGFENVEFHLGQIEALPLESNVADVIISNCVINLSPDKPSVYSEAYRVLKPGGRLAVSDVVATIPIPDAMRDDLALHTGCVAGASSIDDIEAMLHKAGFVDVQINVRGESREIVRGWSEGSRLEDYIASASIEAVKP